MRPHMIKYFTACNKSVTGQDSTLRSFSTIHDKHNKSLGRASYNKAQTKKNSLKYDQHKMPYIVEFVAGRYR